MTSLLPPDTAADRGRVRTLVPGDEQRLRFLLDADPVRHCFAASRLEVGGLRQDALGGFIWGFERGGQLASALLVGANMVPISTDDDSRAGFAEAAIRMGRRSSSIVGPAGEVLDLWRRLEPYWGPARDVRPEQPLMVAVAPPDAPADPQVRASVADDLDVIFPACVAMFTEEVGVSPLVGGTGPAYRRRIAELIRERRSFARFEGGEPVFKAELGAQSATACQVQGVWVRPDRRGEGLAGAGMTAVVAFARERTPLVSLYVNSYNTPALRAYERAGFRQVDTFATVLF